VRRIIMGAVNQKAIARMEPNVVRLVDTLLEEMAAKREVNLIDDFAAQIPIEVIGNLLDIPHEERGPLRGWSVAILSGLEPKLSAEMFESGNRAVSEFVDYLKVLVAARRKKPGDYESDVLTRLIQGEKDGETLTEEELYHQCIFLLNAGHETTTNLIGNGLWALLNNPGELARLRADPSLVPSAIEEMLRYDGPIQLNNRRLTAPMALGGRTLPAGTSITIGIGAANHDPAQFSEPERFDVGRKPNRHLAFGQGDHVCVGMNVARMEGRVALARLIARFAKLELAGAPARDRRVRFRGFRTLPLRVGEMGTVPIFLICTLFSNEKNRDCPQLRYSGLISTLRNLMTPAAYCSAMRPSFSMLFLTSTVFAPFRTSTMWSPLTVMS
jgi:cytochrome P450